MPRTGGTITRQTRRDLGQYYTPQSVAACMVHAGLFGDLESEDSPGDHPLERADDRSDRQSAPREVCPQALNVCVNAPGPGRLPTVLDPACGDGAFLLEAFDQLESWFTKYTSSQPLRGNTNGNPARGMRKTNASIGETLALSEKLCIVRDHLFGVDIDPAAIGDLRQALLARIAPELRQEDDVRRVLKCNFRVGNALTGPAFHEIPDSTPHGAGAIDWNAAFPHIRDAGGFDVILGNPPYRRELYAKELFEEIAATPLGRKWRQARMDLWYYFLHRSLDLLRPGGRLSFIVNSYWTASSGASRLIRRIEREAILEEIVVLGKTPLFTDVAGQHLIFRLRKRASNGSSAAPHNCRILDLSRGGIADHLRPVDDSQPMKSCSSSPAAAAVEMAGTESGPLQYELTPAEMFQHGRLLLGRPDPLVAKLRGLRLLEDEYDIRQGMAENPPCISARHRREFGPQFVVDEGVFVLSADEMQKLDLSAVEARLLRPYFATSALGRYRLPERPTHHVLYLTRHTAPSLEPVPHIARHLSRFRVILERRRETQRGTVAWWQLHWPRDERIFAEPSVLSVQMGREPQFVYAEAPAFVGFSVNVALPRSGDAMSPAALTGVLNSNVAARWFAVFAKRRGVRLEINGGALRQFPLPQRNLSLEAELAVLVSQRQHVERTFPNGGPCSPGAKLDRRIDELVEDLYGLI